MVDISAFDIPGVQRVLLEPHADARGSLTEVYRRQWLPRDGEMLQANLSVSRANVLRGLHFHRRQTDYWCVLSGVAFVGLLDLRGGSPTRGRAVQVRIDAGAERLGLVIPPGVAHGFYAETEVLLLYVVDTYYTGEDEFGLAWNDPGTGISWPVAEPELSERDRANPPLGQALAEAPSYAP